MLPMKSWWILAGIGVTTGFVVAQLTVWPFAALAGWLSMEIATVIWLKRIR